MPAIKSNTIFKLILLILTILSSFIVRSQEPVSPVKADETEISDKIENIAQSSDEIFDYTDLTEDLRYLRENPLNLNFADESDLRKLIFLNDLQVFSLLIYRETYGNFVTIYELQSVEGFDPETIRKILPYVYVSSEKPKEVLSLKKALKYGHNEIITRYQRTLQQQEGYTPVSDSELFESPNSRYLGSQDKIYLRYGFNYRNKVRFGITAEKDAGEAFFKNQVNDSIRKLVGSKLKNGFDFYSAHFSIRDYGVLKALTVGDYQLEFGQGLTLWSGIAYGKSADAVSVKRFGRGVRPSTSANENLFFRGAAATIGIHKIRFTTFYSSHKVDANIEYSDTLAEDAYIQSLQETGLHRTVNELQNKNAIHISAFGGNVSVRKNRFQLGATAFYSKLDKELMNTGELYKQFYFTGKENINAGIDYSFLLRSITFFGEVSASRNGALAQLHGLIASLHPQLFISVLYRNYQKDYQNFFSNAFGEASDNYNENGLYAGLRFLIYRKWVLTAYTDNFRFPWLKYRTDAPSSGNEQLVQLENNFSGNVFMYFRFRGENKQQNASGEPQMMDVLTTIRKSSYRFYIEYGISPSLLLKNRLEYLVYKEGSYYRGTGFLIYQDVVWKAPSDKFSLAFRYAIFDTDSYDERLYAYENDVLYSFSVPAYYDKGSRIYLVADYRLTEKISLQARYAATFFSNQKTIGSGLDEINGSNKSEVKVQVRIHL